MRIAYWDCFSGIAGDMNLGAMVGCGLSVDELRQDLAGLALDGFRIEHRRVVRGTLSADKIDVVIDDAAGVEHNHPHRGLAEIRKVLSASSLSEGVAQQAEAIFESLCGAEATVHGVTIDEVQLHEVGALDAIVDVVGACCGLRRLGIEAIRCSPLNVGSGSVKTAHGVLPVPAPATAHLLRDAPVYSQGPAAELVTPTGAALVAVLAEGFGRWPAMKVRAIGYGAGDHEFDELANVLRLVVGDTLEADEPAAATSEGVSVIETNLDDANPQIVGALLPRLLESGALDAFTTSVSMKKNRPGTKLSVIAANQDLDALAELVLRETTTLGVRIYAVERRELARRHVEVATPWGAVRVKVGLLGDEVVNWAPEFDDCERLARDAGVAVKQVIQAAAAAYAGGADSEEGDA